MADEVVDVLLVEDELPTRELLTGWIAAHPRLRLRGVCADGETALERLQREPVDLCFLDISLPGMTGIEVLERLEKRPGVIFVTASAGHAIQAFDMGVADYLHKPFDRKRFDRAVEKALATMKGRRSPSPEISPRGLLVQEGEDLVVVLFDEIIYVSSHEGRCVVHTDTREIETRKGIHELEAKLPPDRFLRIHKQTLLNLARVSHFQYLIGGRYQVYLKDPDETELTVGRKYAPEFLKHFAH